MDTVAVVCLLTLGVRGVLSSAVDDHPKLRFYYSALDHYTELPLAEAVNIFAHTWYNASRTTVIFAHGFTGRPTGRAVSAIIGSYLEREDSNVALLNWEEWAAASPANFAGRPTGPAVSSILGSYLEREDSNVALLNWEEWAAASPANFAGSYLNWAAPNARKLGVMFADILQKLQSAGLDLGRSHLVGHSLGAQLFGIAGNTLAGKGIQLPWITGLDPANTAFENKPVNARLNPGSAAVVVAIHSDPSKYGFKKSTGTVDFWPNYRNGPVRQPGCPDKSSPRFSPEDLCNHNRSWELLLDALKHPGTVLGCFAKNYRMWKNYSKPDRNAVTLDLGTFGKKVLPGNYYFITNSASPYGLGQDGL